MKLRARLGLTLLLTVVPITLALVWALHSWRQALVIEEMAEAGAERLESMRDRCEEFPRMRRGRRGRGVRIYDDQLRPTRGNRPLEEELRVALKGGAEVATTVTEGRARRRLVARRMPWTGPCSVIVLSRPEPQVGLGVLLAALLPALGAVLVALLAAGPIVSRVRRLTRAVREDAESVVEDGPDELAVLSRAFEDTRTRLREQVDALARRDEALTRYVANTTHDVMIPLTVIQGHLMALRRNAEGSEQDRAILTQTLEESHYLASLVQNLAAAARLEAALPETRVDDVDVGALVERVVARHRPIARGKGIEVDFAVPEVPLTVTGDLTLLEQAISNLVHNAVRYGKEGGHVAVVLEARGRGWRLEVVDDGPGVEAESMTRLTEPRFRSEEARTRHPDGQGLGLAIARDVAARHDLALRFAHGPDGEGLRVTLESG